MINLKNMRLGAVNKSVTGDLMEVVEYENSQNIKVKFLDKYGAEVNTAWQYFESGYIIEVYIKIFKRWKNYNFIFGSI